MSKKTAPRQEGGPRAGNGEKGPNLLLVGVIVVALVCVGVFAFWRTNATVDAGTAGATAAATSTAPAATGGAATTAATPPAVQTPSELHPASPESEAAARKMAALGPHKQSSLPPIPFAVGYAPPRPAAVVTAAYEFAAEHPEVLAYVPCFCGCERGGHRGNEDCFVRTRDAKGDVVAWEEHGVECAVCIDVATRSRQMYTSGASVRDIRSAVEKEFASKSPVMTPTPNPPAHDH
jgi:hypothetical protein